MKDNVLKKEFSKKDVQRARNLITGNTNSRTSQGVGYTKKSEHYIEGDIWEEDGRKWTIKNGIKQNITKMDKFKKMGKMPLFCPECGTLMNKHLDKKVYPSYQKCFNCVTDEEAKLVQKGEYEEHIKTLKNQHIDKVLNEYKNFIQDRIKETNNSFVTEDGTVENWKGSLNKEQLEKDLQEGIEFLENMKIK